MNELKKVVSAIAQSQAQAQGQGSVGSSEPKGDKTAGAASGGGRESNDAGASLGGDTVSFLRYFGF